MAERKVLRLTLLETYRVNADPYETSVPALVKGADETMSLMTAAQRADQHKQVAASTGEDRGALERAWRHDDYFENLSRARKALLRSAHASCWRWGEESEAMWRLYCGTRDGVAVRTTVEKLEAFARQQPHTCISRISYRDYATQSFERYGFDYDPAFHKRQAFKHEQEIRVLRWRKDDFRRAAENTAFDAGGSVELPNWDLEEIADEIVVNPLCSNEYFEAVAMALGRISPVLGARVKLSDHRIDPRW